MSFLPPHIDGDYVRRACAGGRCKPHRAPPLSECTRFDVWRLPGGRIAFRPQGVGEVGLRPTPPGPTSWQWELALRRGTPARGPMGEFYAQSTPWRVPTSWLWERPAWRGPLYGTGAAEPPGLSFGVPPWRSLDGQPTAPPPFGGRAGQIGGSYDWWWWNFGRPANLPYQPPTGLGALGGIALPNTLTPLTADQAAAALATAYKRVTGRAPTQRILSLLIGQTALETGDWKSLHNFNFGNAKATASDVYYTGFRCWELVNGQKTWYEADDPMCRFAAFKTAADGAEQYIRLLKRRANWWAGLQTGTVPGYVAGLTSSPAYFTASADEYARGLTTRMNQFAAQAVKYAGAHKLAVAGTAVGVFALTFGGWYLYNTVTKKRRAA